MSIATATAPIVASSSQAVKAAVTSSIPSVPPHLVASEGLSRRRRPPTGDTGPGCRAAMTASPPRDTPLRPPDYRTSTGGGGVPAAVHGERADVAAETLAQRVTVVQEGSRSGRDKPSIPQQRDMRRGRRKLLQVMGDGDARQGGIVRGQLFEGGEEIRPTRQVQPGRRLV